MPKEKVNYPYLNIKLTIVEHISLPSEDSLGIAGPPTILVEYSNDGNLPSYSAYLMTYWWRQDPDTSIWDHHLYKQEIITVQPGATGSFEYPTPVFLSGKSSHLPTVKPIIADPSPSIPAALTVKYKICSMVFDPLKDPLPISPEDFFASSIDDRHYACTNELTSWPT